MHTSRATRLTTWPLLFTLVAVVGCDTDADSGEESAAPAMASVEVEGEFLEEVAVVAIEAPEDGGEGQEFGNRVATGKDLNGDGVDDILVFALGADEGNGSLWVVSGATLRGELDMGEPVAGLDSSKWDEADLGSTMRLTDDVSGDGAADAVVSIVSYVSDGEVVGAVVALEGGSDSNYSIASEPFIVGEMSFEAVGTSLATGDVSGDGVSDVVVGAPGYNGTIGESGRLRVVLGGAGLGDKQISLGPDGSCDSSILGFGTGSSVGDLDGDGFDDIVASAPYACDLRGSIYLYMGPVVEGTTDSAVEYDVGEVEGVLGRTLVADSDLNGDGRVDIAAVAPLADEPYMSIYLDFSDPDPIRIYSQEASLAAVRTSAGDVDDDGFEDLLLALDTGADERGGVVLFFGGVADDLGRRREQITAAENGQLLGLSASGGSDFDADGLDDFVIGSPGYDSYLGIAHVFFGAADLDGDGLLGASDCDEDDPTVYDGAPETSGDDIDQNCDGQDGGCGCAAPGSAPGLAPTTTGLLVSLALLLNRRRGPRTSPNRCGASIL